MRALEDSAMETQERRSLTRHRIEIKVSEEQKTLIAEAAALAKQGMSEFVRAAAESAAKELIFKNRH
ncbi:MAG TPA: DUF1778 domain-containing protein [Candidatus Baltobacteraceae bacterium]|nr:DUF1778 domain-containing protein [Candidatus Baltobacteraceae bacterium]